MSLSLQAEMFLVDGLLASSTEYAVLLTDSSDRVQWVNEGFIRLYGATLAELQGREAASLPDRRTAMEGTPPEEGRYEARRRDKDGSLRWLTVERRPIVDAQGIVSGYVEIESDITAFKAETERLRDALAQAEAATATKSEFLAHMSHEVRTPVNSILGLSEWALQTPLNPEQREGLELIRNSAQALLSLVNPLLDMSRIESGRLELEHLPFDLRSTLGDVVNTLSVEAYKNGLELACEVERDVPDRLLGDALRLRQVVSNLISNAIKFTPKGEVILHVRRQPRGQEQLVCHFTVRDNGIGIPSDKQAQIFAPFTQAEPSVARLYGGTGLGLTIAKQLVTLMGGRIWVESKPGQGSIFHFTLPLQQAADADAALPLRSPNPGKRLLCAALRKWSAAANGSSVGASLHEQRDRAPTPKPAPAQRLALASSQPAPAVTAKKSKPMGRPARFLRLISGRREVAEAEAPSPGIEACAEPLHVLLVEDNHANRRLAQILVESLGHKVICAEDGAEALSWLRDGRFDLVLMDVQLPVMDGLSVVAALRQQERTLGGHVPVIALTAHARDEDRQRCLAAGMDDYIAKPIQREALGALIDQHCPQVLDRRALLERIASDRVVLEEILSLYRRDFPVLLNKAREAADLQRSEAFDQTMHVLSGMLCNLAATAAQRVAATLQLTVQLPEESPRDWPALTAGLNRLGEEGRRLEAALVALHALLEDRRP
ncbi:MAG TPA: ATP-binding protein [Rhodocyclaceae bacterium]|nr:ATP-binding protein [Rhodocyclaceae bacterium]